MMLIWIFLCTDEAHFYLNDLFHYWHTWGGENSHSILEVSLYLQEVMLGCGIIACFMLGLFFFDN